MDTPTNSSTSLTETLAWPAFSFCLFPSRPSCLHPCAVGSQAHTADEGWRIRGSNMTLSFFPTKTGPVSGSLDVQLFPMFVLFQKGNANHSLRPSPRKSGGVGPSVVAHVQPYLKPCVVPVSPDSPGPLRCKSSLRPPLHSFCQLGLRDRGRGQS